MYKNILVALDLSEDNKVLIKKADTLSPLNMEQNFTLLMLVLITMKCIVV